MQICAVTLILLWWGKTRARKYRTFIHAPFQCFQTCTYPRIERIQISLACWEKQRLKPWTPHKQQTNPHINSLRPWKSMAGVPHRLCSRHAGCQNWWFEWPGLALQFLARTLRQRDPSRNWCHTAIILLSWQRLLTSIKYKMYPGRMFPCSSHSSLTYLLLVVPGPIGTHWDKSNLFLVDSYNVRNTVAIY